MEIRSNARRVARGAMWSLTGTMISRGFTLLAAMAVARIVGKSAFGELGVVQSTLGVFQTFAGLGLGLTATKYVAELRVRDPARTGRIVALVNLTALCAGIVMVVVVVAVAPWLADEMLAAHSLATSLRAGALLMMFGVISGAQTGTLAGFEAFKAIARINTIGGISTFPLMLAGARLDGVRGAIVGNACAMAITCVLNQLALARLCSTEHITPSYRECVSELRLVGRFSFPAMISAMLFVPATWLCNMLLVNSPGGYQEMGLFSAANQWRTAVLYVPAAISTALLPVLADLVGEASWPEFRALLRTNVLWTAVVALALALAVSLLSPIVMLGYGKDFAPGELVLVLLMISTVLASTLNVVGQVIASLDRMWAGAFLNAIWATTLVATTWHFVDRGAVGVALAYLIAYVVHLAGVTAYIVWLLSRRRFVARCVS